MPPAAFRRRGYLLVIAVVFVPIQLLAARFSPADSARRGITLNRWVDSLVEAMSLEERIAQSFMVTAYSKSMAPDPEVVRLVERHRVGGLIFFQGTRRAQAHLTNYYQQRARVPLLVGIDGEWGLGMRLSDGHSYPRAMALAATGNPALAYRAGQLMASDMGRLGVHINFAPVADVNTNPANPVIGIRSFGDSVELVSQMASAMAVGMQQHGVLACAKHFPGHGSVAVDSHKGLPTIERPIDEIAATDMQPFFHLARMGIAATMVGHLAVREHRDTAPEVASLSRRVVQGVLRERVGFQGLVVTDALNMGAVTPDRKPHEVNLAAYMAGNDILLCAQDVPGSIAAIRRAVRAGVIDTATVNARCRRVLQAKYTAMRGRFTPVAEPSEVASSEYEALVREVAAESLTLLQDRRVPIERLDGERIALISYLGEKGEGFASTMRRYAPYTLRTGTLEAGMPPERALQRALGDASLVIIAVRATGYNPKERFGITEAQRAFIAACAEHRPTILVLFGAPYALRFLPSLEQFEGVLLAYDAERATRQMAAQALFGGKAIRGTLPVRVSPTIPRGAGIRKTSILRLSYVTPHEVGADARCIALADSLAQMAIDSVAVPGMQVVAAVGGQVFYSRAFGRYTYSPDSPPVSDTTIYDLASLTKIVATTPLAMRAVEKKKWHSSIPLRSISRGTIAPR